MKNISTWARSHQMLTVLILIPLHVLLGYLFFYTGVYLFLENIRTPSALGTIASCLFLAAWLFYPTKKSKQGIYKNSFFKRKFWQGITIVSVMLFSIHGGNHFSRIVMVNNNSATEYSAENVVLDSKKLKRINKKKTRKERRSLKKMLRKRLRANIKKLRKMKKETDQGKKVLLFILAILGALLLGYLILALSCNLMCSGNETLGWIVLIGGAALILAGLVAIYRKLFIEKKSKEKAVPTDG